MSQHDTSAHEFVAFIEDQIDPQHGKQRDNHAAILALVAGVRHTRWG